MGKNVFEKIITKHIVSGNRIGGAEVGIRIDQTLTQDATGTLVYLAFESLGLSKIKTDLSVSYVDHNTVQDSFENADDHKYLQTVAAKYGIRYSKAGNGICHQVHLERFARPGKTLLGSDSHTPTAGAMGMVAIGAGGLDVALALAGEPFYLTYPKVVKVKLTGKLRPWVTAKDVILNVLGIKTTKGNVNTVIEYSGPGVKTLSLTERATITNMGAELGVTTSLFPSDAVTRKFLLAQGRGNEWKRIEADKDAHYDEVITINLSNLEPLIACPHSPGNVTKVKDLKKVVVDQVCVGSCTNSSFQDLMLVAKMLGKKKIHPDVSFVIAPGSKQVFEMIAKNGALDIMIAAGARILESTCGFCIGIGQAPRDGAVSIRTNNRNFLGRSGTKSAHVYLASPAVAVACAITGRITDPRELKMVYPKILSPKKFVINDRMILFSRKSETRLNVYRGSNIKMPPKLAAAVDAIDAKVLIKVGDKITTDHIMPAGRRLKFRSNIERYADFVFENVDATFVKRARDEKAGIIVAGRSYGQGSSREHAALCPASLGVKAVLALSIERIHRANLINFGILPLTFVHDVGYKTVEEGDLLSIEGIRSVLRALKKGSGPLNVIIKNLTKEKLIIARLELSPREAHVISEGGRLNAVRKLLQRSKRK
ncbi:MAG: aconitate hydratase [Candidatus Omnitrophica bacterium]|nr:aconitate hydratase [Candidatus Omnitrophota bacterium]